MRIGIGYWRERMLTEIEKLIKRHVMIHTDWYDGGHKCLRTIKGTDKAARAIHEKLLKEAEKDILLERPGTWYEYQNGHISVDVKEEDDVSFISMRNLPTDGKSVHITVRRKPDGTDREGD